MVANSGAAAREEAKWSYDTDIAGHRLDFKEEDAYIAEWLTKRMQFLDDKYNGGATNIAGVSSVTPRKDGGTYNLLGQKVTPTKGIYIRNGRKYIK